MGGYVFATLTTCQLFHYKC
uniref:Uncharacterized protein n=1 Tax=Anguilla anguilla TaxID=7936 RepID=A0A0E9RSG6_ANGAN